MNRPANNYSVVARAYDDDEQRAYEVVEDEDGAYWVRDTRVGRPWERVVFLVHANLDAYLQGLHDNFGWRIERVA